MRVSQGAVPVEQGMEGKLPHRRSILLSLLCMLVVVPGCVSRSSYKELEEELRRTRAENTVLSNELNTRKMKRIEALEIQLSSCNKQIADTREAGERLVKKAEEAGYYRGAAEFNRSLQIVGVPSSNGSWIFAEHYYTFQVSLAGQPLYSMTVETEEEMPPILQGLALLSELSEVMPYRSKM